MDMKSCVSHQQVSQLLHNKFLVVLGDSNLRALYKDIVILLQKDNYLTPAHLKTKGEVTFEGDCLIEGGCLNQLNNGTSYREVRQYRSSHHLVRFYFVTRVYSRYMRSILEDFRRGIKPDVVILNSCLWDISRYGYNWVPEYKKNLSEVFEEMVSVLPDETLVIWTQTMPLAEKIRGGFMIPEMADKAPKMGHNVIEANFYSATLAEAHDVDVLDLHYLFRFSLRHRTHDGIHWNAIAHRRITSLLMMHVSQAWGVTMTRPPLLSLPHGENHQKGKQHTVKDFTRGTIKVSFTNVSTSVSQNQPITMPPKSQRRIVHHVPAYHPYKQRRHEALHMFDHPMLPPLPPHLPFHHDPYRSGFLAPHWRQRPYVMRSRHVRHHYFPYHDQRRQCGGSYYR